VAKVKLTVKGARSFAVWLAKRGHTVRDLECPQRRTRLMAEWVLSRGIQLCFIPLLTVPTFRGCDVLTEWQATASAAAECSAVEGGGDLMSSEDLAALAHLAAGNSGTAITARFGLPSSYCGDRVYYPVWTSGEALWAWIDIPASGLAAWGYQTIPPLGG
jgi:hypothetical protein